jgi:uncharacterized protein (DUF2336 family)
MKGRLDALANAKPSNPNNLIDELQETLAHDPVARRVEALRRVTDLFLGRCVDYSDEQIAVFDDVFLCLIDQVETSALALLAERVAGAPNTPAVTMRRLASHELISVAGPPLAQSSLDEETLLTIVRTRGQEHMLAVSQRETVSESVTDVLVDRGNAQVVESIARNDGARFSEHGFTQLVRHAEKRESLASCVALRADIPRHHLLKLLSKASDAVHAALQAKSPGPYADIAITMDEVRRRARASKDLSPSASLAHAMVRSLFENGRINESQLYIFATDGKFDEATAGLACLANVPVDLAEMIMIDKRVEGILILAKVSHLSWPTVQAFIRMRALLSKLPTGDDEENRGSYERLLLTTAQQVLRFHRMQLATSPG